MVDWHHDQAAGLRRMVKAPLRRVIAFVSQNPADSAASLAAAALELAFRGRRVLVIDEHEGTHSVAACLGCPTRFDLLQAARGDVSIDRARVYVTSNLSLLCAARAALELPREETRVKSTAARCIELAEQGAEFVLVNALNQDSVFIPAANRVVFAVQARPAGMTEGYVLIKQIHAVVHQRSYGVVLTRSRDHRLNPALLENLRRVAGDRMNIELENYGSLPVPRDGSIQPVLSVAPPGAGQLADALASVLPAPVTQQPGGVLNRLIEHVGSVARIPSRKRPAHRAL